MLGAEQLAFQLMRRARRRLVPIFPNAARRRVERRAAALPLPDLDAAPLRAVEDVDRCIETFLAPDCDIVITATPARRNPYFNMVVRDTDGVAALAAQPKLRIHRRQSAPEMFDMTTVAYVAGPEFIRAADDIFDGRVRVVVVPPERAIDIDTELDLRFAEFLLQGRSRG